MMLQNIKNRLDVVAVLLVIISVGLIQSSTVLGGDQSLFVVIAQLLDSGKTLYKDLFDYKQPGIFLFYLLAGKTFGWSDIGIHLFELGYWILFSLILFSCIRNYSLFRADYFNSLLPLFIIGAYYGNATIFHLTQLEALINFPLFLIVWLLDRAYKTESGLFVTYLVIGVLIGTVLLSKLVFSPIIFFFLLIHFIFTLKSKDIKYIYFIAETKGSMSTLQLKGSELQKINYARKHFEALSCADLKYDVVDSYESLMEKVMR